MKFWQASSGLLLVSIYIGGMIALSFPMPIHAASECVASGEDELKKLAESEYITELTTPYTLEQPFGGKRTIANIGEYIQTVYQFALGMVGIVAVFLIMYGGLNWVTAGGNEQKIGEAKQTILSAIFGLLLALLSYAILLFISPRLVETDVAVFKIPLPTVCPFPPPVVETVSSADGLNGNGKSVCSGASTELQRIASLMRLGADNTANTGDELCSTCTIGVSSGYRSSESQTALFSCYQRAVAELGVKDGSKCPEGCDTCNLAAEPCCSNHEQGTAVDLWLEGVPSDKGVASSQGYLKTSYNNGGNGGSVATGYNCDSSKDPALCKNQYFLRQIMTISGSKFNGISDEWWHFDYSGGCIAEGSTSCTVGESGVDGFAQTAAEGYCTATKTDGTKLYRYAECTGSKASCQSWGGYSWIYVASGCQSTAACIKHYTFDDADKDSALTQTYIGPPTCEGLYGCK